MVDARDMVKNAVDAVRRLRSNGAHVHCITNTVAQNFTANVLLACGAVPAMTVSPEEALYFTERSDALLINLGTLDGDRKDAIKAALQSAQNGAKPVVLDPVLCHVPPPRLDFAVKLMTSRPAVLRANGDEIAALEGRGVAMTDVCKVQTGKTDQVCWKGQVVRVGNGHPWLADVTAIGCAQGALIAALASQTDEAEVACLAALLWTGIAGEIAADKSAGPGSFAVNYLDALHSVSYEQLTQMARVS